jgi:hypothetical protein
LALSIWFHHPVKSLAPIWEFIATFVLRSDCVISRAFASAVRFQQERKDPFLLNVHFTRITDLIPEQIALLTKLVKACAPLEVNSN